MAGFIAPRGHTRTWAELDEAMWNWNPRNRFRGQFYRTPFQDHRMGGEWLRTLSTPDFAGFCRHIVDFCTDSRPTRDYQPNDGDPRGYGFGFLQQESLDPTIPERPLLRYTGPPGHPLEHLAFSVSPFASPATRACASLEWRVARISAPGVPGFEPGTPWNYELVPVRTGQREPVDSGEFQVDPDACRDGHTYRVRARYRDDTGRASHWSEPIQFTAHKPAD
jgi:hypothetical protein